MQGNDGFTISKSLGEIEGRHEELLNEAQLAAAAEEKEAHSFEIDPAQVSRCNTLLLNYAVHILHFICCSGTLGSTFPFPGLYHVVFVNFAKPLSMYFSNENCLFVLASVDTLLCQFIFNLFYFRF